MAGTDEDVKLSHAAHDASRHFRTIVNGGFRQSIDDLTKAGHTLSDPNVWSGRHAAEFRSAWHTAQGDLHKIKQALDDFHTRFDSVLKAIAEAGGNLHH